MLLLHEFHDKKFLLPDKLSNKVWRAAGAGAGLWARWPCCAPEPDGMFRCCRQATSSVHATCLRLPMHSLQPPLLQEKERLARQAAEAEGGEEGEDEGAPKAGKGKKAKGPQVRARSLRGACAACLLACSRCMSTVRPACATYGVAIARTCPRTLRLTCHLAVHRPAPRCRSTRAAWCWSPRRGCTTALCCYWTSTPCTPPSSRHAGWARGRAGQECRRVCVVQILSRRDLHLLPRPHSPARAHSPPLRPPLPTSPPPRNTTSASPPLSARRHVGLGCSRQHAPAMRCSACSAVLVPLCETSSGGC